MNIADYTDYSPMGWHLKYTVEVAEIDSQHKELMGFFNEAINHCSNDKADERRYFDSAIDAFINLLTKHFRTEEQLLSKESYAQYDEHILEHIKLLEKINLIKSEIENNRWRMNLYILATTLKEMFMYHFNMYDISAKEFFGNGNGVPATEEDNYFVSQS